MLVYTFVYIHIVVSFVYLYLRHVGLDGPDQHHHHDAAEGDVGQAALCVPWHARNSLKVKSDESQSPKKPSNADIMSYLLIQYMRYRHTKNATNSKAVVKKHNFHRLAFPRILPDYFEDSPQKMHLKYGTIGHIITEWLRPRSGCQLFWIV